MILHNELTIYDPSKNIYYIPFVASDGRVGYQIGRTDDRPDAEAFIYLNPSDSEGDLVPNVFVYIGPENDPTQDESQHFYTITNEDFGLGENV
jgi:hypothetical protein